MYKNTRVYITHISFYNVFYRISHSIFWCFGNELKKKKITIPTILIFF
jgi:hypothetical protein